MSRKIFFTTLIACWVSYCTVYWSITKIDSIYLADTPHYISMMKGNNLLDVPAPFRFRILTPYMARATPDFPNYLKIYFDVTEEKLIAFKFGAVNALGLSATAIVLFLVLQNFGFTALESLIGMLLFQTNYVVINWNGIAMVDAWSYFFLIFGLYAIQQSWTWQLGLLFGVGLFFKETTVLVLILTILLMKNHKQTFKQLSYCVPGMISYILFRIKFAPEKASFAEYVAQDGYSWLWIFIDGFQTYGVLWGVAIWGWFICRNERNNAILRVSAIVPCVMIFPFIYLSSIARIWFYTFPAIIPLSIIGLRQIYDVRHEQELDLDS